MSGKGHKGSAMLVYFMRHSITEWNEKKLLNGLTDIPLSKSGIEKCENARNRLEEIIFTKTYSSPLIRAMDTAKIISGMGNDDIIVRDALKERDFGNMEGQSVENIDINELEKISEPHIKIYRRVGKFIAELTKCNEDDICLVLTHGSILRHIYSFINNCEYEELNIDNLGHFVAEFDNNGWNVVLSEFSID